MELDSRLVGLDFKFDVGLFILWHLTWNICSYLVTLDSLALSCGCFVKRWLTPTCRAMITIPGVFTGGVDTPETPLTLKTLSLSVIVMKQPGVSRASTTTSNQTKVENIKASTWNSCRKTLKGSALTRLTGESQWLDKVKRKTADCLFPPPMTLPWLILGDERGILGSCRFRAVIWGFNSIVTSWLFSCVPVTLSTNSGRSHLMCSRQQQVDVIFCALTQQEHTDCAHHSSCQSILIHRQSNYTQINAKCSLRAWAVRRIVFMLTQRCSCWALH